ncbi:tRNA pseudouridine synthase A-like [Salvia splendens]|uniref:tRNA pseudouridine synthase A-like n=1 Tax=Salvia splendens TaxID=180675 RepID=UPI001C25F404|nr:tRNA pseudouridine synthase A-like [Salvia splendens]
MTGEQQSLSLSHQRPESPLRPCKLPRIDGRESTEEESESIERNMTPNSRTQRYLVAIEYIGTRFSGAQQQATCRTAMGVLQDAFQKFVGQPVSIFCSSRTDAGVHALSNVCHVDVERISKRKPGEVLLPHEPAVVLKAVNHFLQKSEGDIMVVDVKCVPSDFHARYKALERTYFYRLLSGKEPLSTFEKDRAWHVPEELNVLDMQKACSVLVGHHDFSSFRAAGCQAKSPIRTLDELTVTEVASSPYFPSVLDREQSSYGLASSVSVSKKLQDDSPSLAGISDELIENSGAVGFHKFGVRKRHRCFVVTARALSFLYHQVRLLVAVLKSVGTGDLTISDVEKILEAKNVMSAPPMAPACGLYLGHVNYNLPSDI